MGLRYEEPRCGEAKFLIGVEGDEKFVLGVSAPPKYHGLGADVDWRARTPSVYFRGKATARR